MKLFELILVCIGVVSILTFVGYMLLTYLGERRATGNYWKELDPEPRSWEGSRSRINRRGKKVIK